MATKKYVSQKQRTTKILVTALIVTVILSTVAIVGASLVPKWIQSGNSMRNQVPLKSEHYKINNCMMTYYYLTDFYSYYNQYGMYLQYMGLDVTKSLAEQSYDESTSWYQYFVNSSANTANAYLLYAEEARANNFEVEDLAELIDKEIDALRESAEAAKIDLEKYITNLFGYGIKESDIRDALELKIYASEYYNSVEAAYSDSITDEEFETYYITNQKSLDKVDYLSYTISADVAEDADEAAKTTAYAEAKAAAENLKANATSKEAYIALVKAALTEANADLETPLTEEEINTKASAVTEAQAYTADNELSEWAFAADRKAGDVTLIDDGNGNYTVYMMEKTAYRQEDPTKNVRHILIKTGDGVSDESAKAEADQVLALYEAGEKTADAFDALAKEYNDDGSSLYENIKKDDNYAEEFKEWIFDETRKEGDTGIVKTQFGYHVMYFAGEGRPQWKIDVYNTLLESYISEMVEGWQEAHTVDINSTALAALTPTIPQTAFSQSTDTEGNNADESAEA
ncbi:MAG: peptidylprolyl isomerase [Clostridia bacterium]|nr:peptidylprolyl isomerase [Clostridia bacterium]